MCSAVYRSAFLCLLLTLIPAEYSSAADRDTIVWVAENVSLKGTHQIILSSITDDTDTDHEGDPAKHIEKSLQDELIKHGVTIVDKSASVSPNTLSLQVHILTYTPGSVGGRWFGFGGGTAACILRSYLVDKSQDEPIAEVIIAKQISAGGLFTANAGQSVVKQAVQQTAQIISSLFGTN